jgi:hypothetical protein
MSEYGIPSVPEGIESEAARNLWECAMRDYEFDPPDAALLTEIVRTVDNLESLDATIRRDGLTVAGSKGQRRVHPALVEARQLRVVLARLVNAARLPVGAVEPAARPVGATRPSRPGGPS